mmetsp:Transcript_19831/g.33175  ORF Transcript_19831/g.33175 Transcript_19831/m.33175 type:complete len:259 (-) Transcript_19831:4651-5427(-)
MEARESRKRKVVESAEQYHQNKRLIDDGFRSLRVSSPRSVPQKLDENAVGGTHIASNPPLLQANTSSVPVEDASIGLPSERSSSDHTVDNDEMIAILKGGRRKYLRKVDYLVDNIIRKTHRTCSSVHGECNYLDPSIPSSVGPHPLTDSPLGMLWPTVVPSPGGPAMLLPPPQSEMNKISLSLDADSDDDDDTAMKSIHSTENLGVGSYCGSELRLENMHMEEDTTNLSATTSTGSDCQKNYHSGAITHSDWGIEDIT